MSLSVCAFAKGDSILSDCVMVWVTSLKWSRRRHPDREDEVGSYRDLKSQYPEINSGWQSVITVYLAAFGLFAPYSDLPCFLLGTGFASYFPLTIWYFTHGRSFTLPPLTKTTLCSWRVWDSPGIYANTSVPLDNLTFANFLCAELGFFGVITDTFKQTHLLNGAGIAIFLLLFNLLIPNWSAGAFDLNVFFFLPFLISWLIVGMRAHFDNY